MEGRIAVLTIVIRVSWELIPGIGLDWAEQVTGFS